MNSIQHQTQKIASLNADELPAYFEEWADPKAEELGLVRPWIAASDHREIRRAQAEIERRIDVLYGLLERLGEDPRPRRQRYLGCRLIDHLIRAGELVVAPFDGALIHNDSIDFRFGNTVWVPRPGRTLRPATTARADFEAAHTRVSLSSGRPYLLYPGQIVNVEMLEHIKLSKRYGIEVENISRDARLQISAVLASRLHAGHEGGVMLEVRNVGVAVREIFAGDVGAQGFLYEVEGACSEHRPNGMPYPESRPEAVLADVAVVTR